MMVSGKIKGQHVLLWSVCVACLLPAVVNAHCAKLEFPTGTTDKAGETTIRVPENQSAKVHFILHTTADCGDIRPEQFTVSISRKDPNHVFVDLCKQQLNGSRSYGTENCDIQRENGGYIWDRIVRRGDDAQWRWRAAYGTAEASQTIHLDVTYPLVIVHISKRSSPSSAAEPGSSVNLVCSYEKGNPDVAPFIKDYQGRKLEVHRDKPGEVRHTANDVSCSDMGMFSCEAPGAVKNQTMPLLVKCPLIFLKKTATPKKFVLDLQKNAALDFPVRSHTDKFSACWLSLWGDHANSSHKPVNCLSYIKAMNSPPVMTLVFAVPNVTGVHLGQWSLNVSNDAGSDHVLFEITSATASGPDVLSQPSGATVVPLHIASSTTRGPFYLPDTTTSPKQTNDNDDNGTAGVVFASIFVVIILILVISIIAFFLTRQYRRRMDLPCHLCTRRHDCEMNEQSPPDPDWNVYVVPDAALSGNRSGAAGGEVTGSHLYEGLQIALPPGNVYEVPKRQDCSQARCSEDHQYIALG